jgi:hypothetical protein
LTLGGRLSGISPFATDVRAIAFTAKTASEWEKILSFPRENPKVSVKIAHLHY